MDCQQKFYKIIDWFSKQSFNAYGSSRDPNYPDVDILGYSIKDVPVPYKKGERCGCEYGKSLTETERKTIVFVKKRFYIKFCE